jgi:hypothetical protein
MNAAHAQRQQPDSSDWTILSPRVPVFRTDAGLPLEQPWHLCFVTFAAPVATRIGQPESAALLKQLSPAPPHAPASEAQSLLQDQRQHLYSERHLLFPNIICNCIDVADTTMQAVEQSQLLQPYIHIPPRRSHSVTTSLPMPVKRGHRWRARSVRAWMSTPCATSRRWSLTPEVDTSARASRRWACAHVDPRPS